MPLSLAIFIQILPLFLQYMGQLFGHSLHFGIWKVYINFVKFLLTFVAIMVQKYLLIKCEYIQVIMDM